MKQSNKPTPLTIAQAEQAKSSSLWAVNSSGGNGMSKGIVNVTVTEGNGRNTVVRVPVTFIPIDLTERATKNALLMSPDFRRMVSHRYITLISEEDAQAMLSSDEARAEQRRLMNLDQEHMIQDSQLPEAVQSIKAEQQGNIGGFAMSIAHTTDGDEDAVVSNLRNNLDTLNQDELQFIVNNSQFPKVKTLAAEAIVR